MGSLAKQTCWPCGAKEDEGGGYSVNQKPPSFPLSAVVLQAADHRGTEVEASPQRVANGLVQICPFHFFESSKNTGLRHALLRKCKTVLLHFQARL